MATGRLSEVQQDGLPLMAPPGDLQLPDGPLLERYVQKRDESAFAALVERYSSLVLGVCERVLQDRHLAEDAFQATFLVLVRRADSLDGQRSLGSWLYAVAYRTALKAKALAARRRARERQVVDMPAVQASEEAIWSDLGPVLDEELNQLPAKYRTPLVLCCLQGKTHQQAARELGWPSGSMSRRMTRARDLLRTRLTRRGITLSTGVLLTMLLRGGTASAASAALKGSTVKAAMVFGGAALLTGSAAASANVIALTHAALKATPVAKTISAATKLFILFGVCGAIALGATIGLAYKMSSAGPRLTIVGGHCGVNASGPGTLNAGWQLASTIEGHNSEVISLAFSADGKVLASASKRESFIRIWDPATGQELRRLQGHQGDVNAVACNPAAQTVISASADGTLKEWRWQDGRSLATFRGHSAGVLCLSVTPDGKTLASGSDDKSIKIWDLAAHHLQQSIAGHGGPVSAVALAPAGNMVASGSLDSSARIWDVSTGRELALLDQHTGPIHCVSFSPDGKKLATGSQDKTVALWDLSPYQVRKLFSSHAGPVNSLIFTPDSKLLITAGQDKTVKVWDVRPVGLAALNGQELANLQGHTASVNALALARESLSLATGSADQTIRLWQMDQRLRGVK